MSLGVVINAPEGIVLAAESRITLTAILPGSSAPLYVSFDNATKLLTFNKRQIGAVTYGAGAINIRTAHSYLAEFEAEIGDKALSVEAFARCLGQFYQKRWEASGMEPGIAPMHFLVAGFNESDAYGQTWEVEIPTHPEPQRKHATDEFGVSWGGQREIVDRVIQGYDNRILAVAKQVLSLDDTQIDLLRGHLKQFEFKIPLLAMPLQDCVDLAIFMIRTTIEGQHLTVGIRGTGGPIDVATITRQEGLKPIQQKEVRGERRND